MITHEGKELLWYVRIRQGSVQALAETVYYRTNMTFEFATRWRWYFLYREALARVEKPTYFTEFKMGSFEAPALDAQKMQLKRLKDRITNKKGKITEKENLMAKAVTFWNSFFPIEEDQYYILATVKIKSLKTELAEMEAEYESILNQ